MTTPPTDADLIAVVVREARLLDEHRFDDWLDLYTEDCLYWMPLEWGQTDARLTASLMHEDKLLLKIRVQRLAGNRTFSQKPKSRCHHVLQTPTVDTCDDTGGNWHLYTPFHYVETRLDEQNFFAGWARHHLVRVDGALKIKVKRIDLVNCDAAFGNIQLFM